MGEPLDYQPNMRGYLMDKAVCNRCAINFSVTFLLQNVMDLWQHNPRR
jgi:hypothetical protein